MTKTQQAPTPRPWRLHRSTTGNLYVVADAPDHEEGKPFRGQLIAAETTDPNTRENLAYIVRACNSHDALVAACLAALESYRFIPLPALGSEADRALANARNKLRDALAGEPQTQETP